jgi:hypothetical protein
MTGSGRDCLSDYLIHIEIQDIAQATGAGLTIYAVFKLQYLKLKHKANHFALRAKLFIKATQQTYQELQALRSA